ncbi:hypothetical protein [Notoacmeibacter marinus]|nr:hypothetical protein [Notoacmeibacter marinus]
MVQRHERYQRHLWQWLCPDPVRRMRAMLSALDAAAKTVDVSHIEPFEAA